MVSVRQPHWHWLSAVLISRSPTAIKRLVQTRLPPKLKREVNTLCSKSASVPLTGTGLRLKAVVEQMREQVQNVE